MRSEGVICLALISLAYNVEERDFDIFKYMLDHHCADGMVTSEIYNIVAPLMFSDEELERIDFIKLSFEEYRKIFESNTFLDTGRIQFDRYIRELDGIEISAAAQEAKQKCLDLIATAKE